MEGKALYNNINNFFAYFCKNDERASCVYGFEREKLMIDLAICFYMP